MLGLGSQAQLGLGIAVILQDRFSANAQKVVSSMQAMKKASNSMMDQIARNYQQGQIRMATATGLASLGMYRLAKDGADLSHKVTQTLVIGGKGLGKSREEIKAMMHDITQEFAQMPEGIGDALLDNVRAGC